MVSRWPAIGVSINDLHAEYRQIIGLRAMREEVERQSVDQIANRQVAMPVGGGDKARQTRRLVVESGCVHAVGVEQHLVSGPQRVLLQPVLDVENAQQASLDLPEL